LYKALESIGNPVHWSSHIRKVQEGVPLFGVLYTALHCFYTRDCFQDLDPWPYGHMTTTLPVAPRLPLTLESIKFSNSKIQDWLQVVWQFLLTLNVKDSKAEVEVVGNAWSGNSQDLCTDTVWSREFDFQECLLLCC